MTNRAGIQFVWVPRGSFMMGSNNGNPDEKPVHRVTFKEGFYMGRYELTQTQWRAVMGGGDCGEGENFPAACISWSDTQKFIRLLNAKNDGYEYALPTEAEWEYASRAKTKGDFADDLDSMAWYDKNSDFKAHPVGQKRPNAFGLYDMQGNVGEWCEDWYHETYNGAPTNGSAWLTGGQLKSRVNRGCVYNDPAEVCRFAIRSEPRMDVADNHEGMRVVAVPRTQPLTIKNEIGMELVLVPAGSFTMGSDTGYDNEKPAHKVTISRPFFMGKREVTQAQWQAVMGNNPSSFKGDNLPVDDVSWDDAQQFVKKLNEMNDGFDYRLPTEAEWEYACRASTTGDYAGDLDTIAWYANNSGKTYLDASKIWRADQTNYAKRLSDNGNQTHLVGTKLPNAFGLYDMVGNVDEWCQDRYDEKYYGTSPVADPQGPPAGGTRVLRGGSWGSVGYWLRSANRSQGNGPEDHDIAWINQVFSTVPLPSGTGIRLVAFARTQ